ncbi:HAMP domain-containing histidine kinase [Nostoc sp. WHI]|uniref:HAMP domain-containing histidine kinase n=1 Tax=Nostoc sp. WHI TaxID=2650611 RepID=UPI0018C4F4FB|nr:HAMP domain-containing histidine kinase [Nostoc sp. WHI]MBG1269960.1 HAMP domain-containing histidine kinase [Nostoc sp. WHI]
MFKLSSLKSLLRYDSTAKTSLTRKTLLNMTLRVAGVILISTGVSYFHVISNLEVQTKKQLEKYITERGQRVSTVFKLIDSTVMILQHRFNATDKRSEIRVVRDYGSLPQVECYAGELNQVLLNLLANAIDALERHGGKLSCVSVPGEGSEFVIEIPMRQR